MAQCEVGASTPRGRRLRAVTVQFVHDVAQKCYGNRMPTTTVRLDEEDERILDQLAPAYGGRSNAIRQALRRLAAERDRHEALDGFLTAWQREAGPVDEDAVEAMAQRYGL